MDVNLRGYCFNLGWLVYRFFFVELMFREGIEVVGNIRISDICRDA